MQNVQFKLCVLNQESFMFNSLTVWGPAHFFWSCPPYIFTKGIIVPFIITKFKYIIHQNEGK